MIETAWRMNIAAALIAAATGLIAVPLQAADEAPEAKDAAPATPAEPVAEPEKPKLDVTWTPPKGTKVSVGTRITAKAVARDDANRWQSLQEALYLTDLRSSPGRQWRWPRCSTRAKGARLRAQDTLR